MGQFESAGSAGRLVQGPSAGILAVMPDRASKRPRDVNSLAARLVAESVGDEKVTPPPAEDISWPI